MARDKLYRDVVHTDIILDPFAVAVIDSCEFQRLDGIKQLGFAYLSYRGAKGSRFEHSVGTYWLCKQLVQILLSNHERLGIPIPVDMLSEDLTRDQFSGLEKVVSWAGLLHDITHIPFGHTLEDEFSHLYDKHDSFESPRIVHLLYSKNSELAKVFDREKRWLDFLPNNELRDLLCLIIQYEDAFAQSTSAKKPFPDLLIEAKNNINEGRCKVKLPQNATALVSEHIDRLLGAYELFFSNKKLFQPFMKDIVGNTVCSDILDYIRRDARSTGLQINYDDRLLEYFILAKERDLGKFFLRLALCVRDPTKGTLRLDLISEVFNVMKSRYDMVDRVYYHKTKVAASSMLGKALRLTSEHLNPLANADANHKYSVLPPESDPYEDIAEGIESILDVRMTDDGLLRWLEDNAQGFLKSGQNSQESQRTLDLVRALRVRNLYKPCVIITTDIARTLFGITGVGEFTTPYRENSNSLTKCNKLEQDICAKASVDNGTVIIYCPSYESQAKEIETRLLLHGPFAETLGGGSLGEIYKDEIEIFRNRYERLWKLYVFVHPNVFSDIDKRHRVVEAFCEISNIDSQYYQRLAPFHWLTWDQRERWIRFKDWKNSQRELPLCHPLVTESSSDTMSWDRLWSGYGNSGVEFVEGKEVEQLSLCIYLEEWLQELPQRKISGRQVSNPASLKNTLLQVCSEPEKWVALLNKIGMSRRQTNIRITEDSLLIREAYFTLLDNLSSIQGALNLQDQ